MESSHAPLARAPLSASTRDRILGAVTALASTATLVFIGVALYLWHLTLQVRHNNGLGVALSLMATACVFVSAAVALLSVAVTRATGRD